MPSKSLKIKIQNKCRLSITSFTIRQPQSGLIERTNKLRQ